jgi:hypothetical protein
MTARQGQQDGEKISRQDDPGSKTARCEKAGMMSRYRENFFEGEKAVAGRHNLFPPLWLIGIEAHVSETGIGS